MIKIEPLKELIKTILYSGYIVGEKPISVIFIGRVGSGKSEIINFFKITDNIAHFTDITYMGLIKLMQENPNLRHICIPDFLKITMKKKSTTDNITSCFNALMEEGLDKVSLMGQSYDFKGKQAGIITATTKASFAQHKNSWAAMGFLSRMLIISYDYKDQTIEDIFKYIFNREYLTEIKPKIEMPLRNQDIKLDKKLAKKLRDKNTDFRRQKQLQTLVMARALLKGKTEVSMQEIREINKFKQFLNLNFTKI